MEKKYCQRCDMEDMEKLPGCPLQCRSKQCKAYQPTSKIDPETAPIVWILGGPGCGKLTQCKKIVEVYGFTHLSTGDILREEIMRGSPRARCLTSVMERGGLVPNDLVLSVVKEAMEKAAENVCHGYLVDGYPREKSQGIEFERVIGPVSLILYFEASPETLTKRLLSRAQTSDRKDDNETSIKLRIHTFLKHNQAVLDRYADRVVRINAEPDPDEIFIEVRKAMDPIVGRAQAVVAQKNAAAAAERAKAMAEFTESGSNIARMSNPKLQGFFAKAKGAASSAQAMAKSAHEAAALAKSKMKKRNILGARESTDKHAK